LDKILGLRQLAKLLWLLHFKDLLASDMPIGIVFAISRNLVDAGASKSTPKSIILGAQPCGTERIAGNERYKLSLGHCC
jgi:hypothetical protein